MKSKVWFSIFLLSMALTAHGQRSDTASPMQTEPSQGYVPDKETAIRIAEAIWLPLFGEKIYNKKPFVAKLVNGNKWIVCGSLREPDPAKGIYPTGGVPYAEILKKDGKIITVYHSR